MKDPSTRTGDQKLSNALIANLPALRRHAVALVGSVAQADELVLGCIEQAPRESAQLREIPRVAGSLRHILPDLYADELHATHARSKEEGISELADQLELTTETGKIRRPILQEQIANIELPGHNVFSDGKTLTSTPRSSVISAMALRPRTNVNGHGT